MGLTRAPRQKKGGGTIIWRRRLSPLHVAEAPRELRFLKIYAPIDLSR
jgi:hypothetical protein